MTKNTHKYISNEFMKKKYEHTFLYFLLTYIVKLIYNDKYIFLSFIVEIEISRVSNTNYPIHQFQILTYVPFKKS